MLEWKNIINRATPNSREVSPKKCQMSMKNRIWEKKNFENEMKKHRVLDEKSGNGDTGEVRWPLKMISQEEKDQDVVACSWKISSFILKLC